MHKESEHIEQWKLGVIVRLKWEPDKQLQQRDFETLSDEILKTTGVDLSTATLRRVWMNQYKKLPQVHTLDAMAVFLGHGNWHEFKKCTSEVGNGKIRFMDKRANIWLLAVLVTVLIICIGLIDTQSSSIQLPEVSLSTDGAEYSGVPATVGFQYDINKAALPVEIELSWNPLERTVLDTAKHFYTGVYFYPDYHRAKLFANSQLLIQVPVYVTTDDWHALVMKEDNDLQPLYIDRPDFIREGKMGLTEEVINGYLPQLPEKLFTVFTLSNSLMEQFNGDDFVLQASFNNELLKADPTCNGVGLLIKGEKGFGLIPIGKKGCYGNMELVYGERVIRGKMNDLSNLTTDTYQKQGFRLTVSDGRVEIRLSQNDPYVFNYEQSLGKLKVLKFIFSGLGSVHQISITGAGDAQYNSDFSQGNF